MKLKIKTWIIFKKFGMNQIPYFLDSTNINISDEELALCIQEQIYGEK